MAHVCLVISSVTHVEFAQAGVVGHDERSRLMPPLAVLRKIASLRLIADAPAAPYLWAIAMSSVLDCLKLGSWKALRCQQVEVVRGFVEECGFETCAIGFCAIVMVSRLAAV